MNKIALFGAAGATGKSIASALRSRGMAYRVVGRDRERLDATFGTDPLAEVVTWNPDDPASVIAAARGIDTLIYLVGVPYHQGELHPKLTRQTLNGAIASGVKRIVSIGSVYPYGVPTTPTVAETHPLNPPTFKGKMRKEQEDILLRSHAEGKIQATILRLPDFYGPEVGQLSMLHFPLKAATKGGTALMIGPIDTPHDFLFVPDLGPIMVDLATHPEAYGRAWNLAGAGTITQREAARQIFAMAGRKPKLFVLGKTALRISGLFDKLMREIVEMHYLQTNPVLLNDDALAQLIGPICKTSYAEGLRQTFEVYRAAAQNSSVPHSKRAGKALTF